MALTPSNSFPTNSQAPDFRLLDTVSGKKVNLKELKGEKGEKGTAIFFICNHCPFVIHVNKELVNLSNAYSSKGISFIAISSNDVKTYPQDGPEQMKIVAEKHNYSFPYLYDETQEVAKSYNAACTPDFYLFDSELKSTYHGQLDDSRPGNGIEVTGKDMKDALEALLTGESPLEGQKPSIGCGIKWRLAI